VIVAVALVVAGLIVAGGIWLAAQQVTAEIRASREELARARTLAIVQTLTPGIAAAQADPRALLVWQPVARTIRQTFPTECAALDCAAGGSFPFTANQIESAHARWTAEWLAWERQHDAEYKRRTTELEEQVHAAGGSPASRARLDAAESEKLDLYQRRYQEYVQVAKALQGLLA
jgi:hypothetical protein